MGKSLFMTHGAFYLFKTDDEQKITSKKKRGDETRMVRSIGLEPTTPTMSRWCSNQLSYERIVVVTTGTNISGSRRMWQGENVQFHVTGEVLRTSGVFFFC